MHTTPPKLWRTSTGEIIWLRENDEARPTLPIDEWIELMMSGPNDGTPGPAEEAERRDDIIDIFGMLTPEPMLKPDMLPNPIRDFAVDVADRMGVSLPTVAMVALGVCAGALHSDIRVQVRQHDTKWLERPTLWLMGIGDPSMKKSPALDAATEPLERIEREWREADHEVIKKYEKALAAYNEQCKVWNRLTAQGKDAGPEPQEPEEPMRRRLLADDFTMEALRDILAVNPRGVLIKSDELTGFIGGFDAYKPGKTGGDRAKALRLFNGGQYVVDRSGNDLLVPNWCAGIVGNIQDAKLAHLAKTLTDDGLMQRFLVYRIERTGTGEDRVPNREALERYEMLIRWLTNLQPTGAVVRWSEPAQDIRRDVEKIVNALSGIPALSPALKGNIGKLDGIFARLALTMHAVDHYDRHGYMLADTDFLTISAATAKQARELTVSFLIPSVVTIYREFFGQHDEFGNDARWIAGYVLAHGSQLITERELYRANHEFKDDRERVRRACGALIDANWLTEAATRQANSSAWAVNRDVHIKFADRARSEKENREAVRQRIRDHGEQLREIWPE